MSTKDKLLMRLFSRPNDFQWSELETLMTGLGYRPLEGRGSRVKFYNKTLNSVITLHKPHPRKILKRYAIDQLIETLEEKGFHP